MAWWSTASTGRVTVIERCGAHVPSSPSGLLVIIPNELGAVRTRAEGDQFSRDSVLNVGTEG
jgi:hypothetical protein